MPLYEYYCEHCDGVFEARRMMRESSEPASCPVCDGESQRIMPTSFAAFTFTNGHTVQIPDLGITARRKRNTDPMKPHREALKKLQKERYVSPLLSQSTPQGQPKPQGPQPPRRK
jgi:putative FmdB family regulatory protein